MSQLFEIEAPFKVFYPWGESGIIHLDDWEACTIWENQNVLVLSFPVCTVAS